MGKNIQKDKAQGPHKKRGQYHGFPQNPKGKLASNKFPIKRGVEAPIFTSTFSDPYQIYVGFTLENLATT